MSRSIHRSEPERFWSKIRLPVTENGCMLWAGSRDHLGYGKFKFRRVSPIAAHRVAWEYCNGPIPAGLEIDHLCRNKSCVRPDHLDVVTHSENMLRAYALKPKVMNVAAIRSREWRRANR